MAIKIKSCSLVIVGLIALSHFTAEAAPAERSSSVPTTASDLSAAPSERLFDLSSWVNRNPYYTYNTRPYYTGGYNPYNTYNNRYPVYQNQGGWNTQNNGYYPTVGTGGYGGGNGGYGGFGGNGGLTTYYGYGRDDYFGDRNMGYGYQQGTNLNGFSREGDRNLYNSYNSYPSSSSSSAASASSSGGVNGYVY